MKLITLNTWGGKIYEPLIAFLRQNRDVDIFCFQEIFDGAVVTRPIHEESRMDIFSKIGEILLDHQGYFSPDQDNEEGLAIFIKKTIPVTKIDRAKSTKF